VRHTTDDVTRRDLLDCYYPTMHYRLAVASHFANLVLNKDTVHSSAHYERESVISR